MPARPKGSEGDARIVGGGRCPRRGAFGVLALAAVGMAACGSSSSSSSSSASSGGSAGGGSSSNAATTSPGELSPAGSQSRSRGCWLGLRRLASRSPWSKPIRKGKKIAYISNLNVSGKIVSSGIEHRGWVVGWQLQEINPTGNTASAYATAMTAALQAKPDAIAME